ncbi:hypothetical protein F4803DRAFT_566384 [Xylaria telfairii]|nr:hypothetical protein F4803DRAFT_566384 [Xylaria telfairii]
MNPVISPELRSAQEYRFPEDQANNIVDMLTYYNKDPRFSTISFSIREFRGDWHWMTESFSSTSNATLGYLERLIPSNVLFVVLENLDLYSLFRFRQASRRSRDIVGSIPHRRYQRVFAHSYVLLRALFKSGLATEVSLLDVDTALCTEPCVVCGEFSGFISIPLWKRCCRFCLQRAPELRMHSRTSAVRNFGLTASQTKQLRQFRVFEGKYGRDGLKTNEGQYIIVSAYQASTISGRPPPPTLQRDECLRIKFNFMACCPLPFCDGSSENPMAEHGFSCLGCYWAEKHHKTIASSDMIEKLYTKDGFLRHFRWCRQAQLLWDSVQRGEALPPALLFMIEATPNEDE